MESGKVYFGKYKIIKTIGEGGTSEVYLAENIKIGTKWAIKKAYREQEIISLHAEPKILKMLDHPAIPKIVDIEEDDEAIYIIEQYVEGINLKNYRLQYGQIDEEILVSWALQIGEILIYLHERKPYPIIFRDLKPENIILRENNRVSLVDFGIAREYKVSSLNDTVQIGTKGYAAPEQYGIGQSDSRTDIFSLGVTLYYLLTGRNLSNLPYRIEGIKEYAPWISEELESIILKCCELLPNNRYQDVTTLMNDLKSYQYKRTQTESLHQHIDIAKFCIKQKRKKFLFFQKKSNQIDKTVFIGMMGVVSSVGVTHTCLMLATFLVGKYKVAVIEMNHSTDLCCICGVDPEQIGKETHISKFKKVDYYINIELPLFTANYRDQYDYVLIDFGDYSEMVTIEDFVRCDERLIIAHGMDWKVKEILSFYKKTEFYDPHHCWKYLIPFLDKKHSKDLKRYVNNKVINIPFNMNPLELNQETKEVLESLMI